MSVEFDKNKFLEIHMLDVASDFLGAIMNESVYPNLYFDGTEEELDEKIEKGKMIKFYADEDLEGKDPCKSYWKIKGSTILSYTIDPNFDEEEDDNVNKAEKKGKVITMEFKNKDKK